MWPVESRSLSPDEVVADVRQTNDAAAALLAALEQIAHVFADCAARGLGLDVYYHANP